MIRLGLRLTLAGGKQAAVRLIITAAAVALGSALLLITLAGISAVLAQGARYAWLDTGAVPVPPARPGSAAAGASAPAADPMWWLFSRDEFNGQVIGRVDIAATGPRPPVPPGIRHVPGPGQFYASPALSALLRSVPAGQLGDRFPGHQIGTIGPAALPAPSSLVIIIGRSAGQLAHLPGARKVTSIQTTAPEVCFGCVVAINARGTQIILSVVACALLFPVLIFIAAATRMSAARREQRFAAMRLAGATPRQVCVICAVESTAAAVAGTAAGFALFFLLRSPLAAVPFTGAPFFPADLSLRPAGILAVAAGVPAAAAAAALLALRRVRISPLGVSRRVTPPAPRGWRVIPLLAGIAELCLVASVGRPATSGGQIQAYLTGFLLIMAGLVIAGPWLVMAGSQILARRASRPAALIAARRLSDDPRAAFRAISGLILALFVTSVAVGVITTITANGGTPGGAAAAGGVLVDQFTGPGSAPAGGTVAPVPGALVTKLRSIRGVGGVTVIRTNPLRITIPSAELGLPPAFGPVMAGLVSCAQLSRTPALGRCPAGADAAAIPPQVPVRPGTSAQAALVWPAAAISARRLEHLAVQSIVVGTDGSAPAVERARTVLEVAYPGLGSPATISEMNANDPNNQGLAGEQQLADVVILASLSVAGCSLAVSVASGLSDRRRPFSLLRLTGVPLSTLRRVVALESAVPLLVAAAVATGTGFLAAELFLRTQLQYSLRPPGAEYYLLVLAGLAACLAIIASALPLLTRITGPEAARSQ